MGTLRPLLQLVLAATVASCCSVTRPGDNLSLGGSQVYYSPDGTIFALGNRSRFENEDFLEAERLRSPLPRWLEFLRLGKWEYRYPNGRKKAVISYEIAWYTECCTGGYCEQQYEARSGHFEAWWPSGAQLARGTFGSKWERVEANCGGDKVRRAVLTRDAQFWDEAGIPADRSILDVAGVPLEKL